MHLIGVLASGVRGAELGTVELYKRATSTRATWYETFEGDGPNATGADIALDSNGGVVAFVDELVTVVVKNASGTVIREFTAGVNDNSVEVVSTSFTGTDYETGASGANLPTTLAAVLDRWFTSAGTKDWNVLQGGIATTLAQAVSGNIYISVTSSAFGATGDGVTDDTAAINAAILAASVRGGMTVYFPPGTYLCTATLNVKANVGLLGTSKSYVKRETSSFSVLTFENVALSEYHVSQLTFIDMPSGTTQPMFTVPQATRLVMESCFVYETTSIGSNSPAFNGASGALTLLNCAFYIRGGTGCIVVKTGTAVNLVTTMVGCTVNWLGSTSFSTIGISGVVQLNGNLFNFPIAAALSYASGLIRPYAPSNICGNRFTTSAADTDTIYAILPDGAAGATAYNEIVESGNQLDGAFRLETVSSGRMIARSRAMRRVALTIGAPGTLTFQRDWGLVVVTTTGIAGTYVMALSPSGGITNGEMEIIIRNTSAANHLVDFTGASPADVGVAVNAGLVLRVRYVLAEVGVTTTWFRMTGFTVSVI